MFLLSSYIGLLLEKFDSHKYEEIKKGSKAKNKVSLQQLCGSFVKEINEKITGAILFSDTLWTKDTRLSSWEVIYRRFKDDNPRITVRTIRIDDSVPVSEATSIDVANFLL